MLHVSGEKRYQTHRARNYQRRPNQKNQHPDIITRFRQVQKMLQCAYVPHLVESDAADRTKPVAVDVRSVIEGGHVNCGGSAANE